MTELIKSLTERITDITAKASVYKNSISNSKFYLAGVGISIVANFVFPNATHCSDLSSDELSLPIREKLEFWMKGNTCVFGINVLDSCVCYPNYGGDRCDIATVSEERFWIVTIMTVISPFLMIITIGGATWWIFRKIQEDQYLMTLKY